MINYKKIIKSRNNREAILRTLSFVPSKPMLQIQYRLHNGFRLDLKEPKRYTEKLQWYKLYYHDPIMKQCVDKYEVRKYVKNKGLENILIPQYGVFTNIDDIDWRNMPERFVMKLTNGGGGLNCIFCQDKKEFDCEEAKKLLKGWLDKMPGKSYGREWAYDYIKPRIVCEELLCSDNQNGSGLDDYKFFCFDGKIAMKWVDYDRYAEHKRVLYDGDGKRLDVKCTYRNLEKFSYPKKAFEEMQPIVEILASDFPHVRVDLYYVDGRVYFGELTFYSGSGYESFDPDIYDFELGSKFNLPMKRL